MARKREHWGSRIGIILAVAGSAVGLGNFLRFPAKATLNGGGAFMIPYFIAFLLLGIPLMWIEWTLGRMGGRHGHGTAPGMFREIGKSRAFGFLGTMGVLGPFLILIYYMYVESWSLGYAYFSFTGKLFQASDQASFRTFLSDYQGITSGTYFNGLGAAYTFLVLTFLANFYFIWRGVRGGIETLAKYGMPALVIIGIVLAGRVLSLGTPDPTHPELSVGNALGFVWNPDFTALNNSRVWLEAAGQIFFTLSVGIGVILTYASYLKSKDDVTLSGLTAASTNEFCEVILGASIIIPAAFVFLGSAGARGVAESGIFNLGFVTTPLIFQQIPLGAAFAGLWFLLLFLAGITSSASLIQPAVAFLEDEFRLTRGKATVVLALIAFVATQPAVLLIRHGAVDELDFWGGTLFLVVFATLETILFGWVLGMKKGWHEMHQGALLRVPRAYRFIIKYVTPAFLLCLLGFWSYQQFWPTIVLKNAPEADRPSIWMVRGMILLLWIVLIGLTAVAFRRRDRKGAQS